MLADMLLLKPCNGVAGNQHPGRGFLNQPFKRFSKIFVQKSTVVFELGFVACNSTNQANKFTKMFVTNKKAEKRYLS